MKRALFGAPVLLLATSAAAEECPRQRPTDPSGYAGYVYEGTPKSYATPEGNVRVWWTESGVHAAPLATTRTDGVPDVVATLGDVAEKAKVGFEKLGFKPAKKDGDYPTCASNGGDDRYDIYLVAFKGADGLTATERCVGTPSVCPGFMLVEKNFVARGYKTAREGAETVVAHEYFHMVQNAYDQRMDRFWAEGTAQWAVKRVFPHIVDLERFLPDFFADVERPIDTPPAGVTAGFLYGAAIFPVFLGEKHGDATVREIMDALGKGTTPMLAAAEEVFAAKGTSLPDEFATFTSWNLATGARAGDGGYASAAKYPMADLTGDFADGVDATLEGITAGFSARYYATHDPTPRTISLETDDTRLGGLALPVIDGKVQLASAQKLPARVEGESILVLYGRSSKKTDVRYTLHAAKIEEPAVTPPPATNEEGSGCSTGRTSTTPMWMVALVLALAAWRARAS